MTRMCYFSFKASQKVTAGGTLLSPQLRPKREEEEAAEESTTHGSSLKMLSRQRETLQADADDRSIIELEKAVEQRA